jgi:hypothetical protein
MLIYKKRGLSLTNVLVLCEIKRGRHKQRCLSEFKNYNINKHTFIYTLIVCRSCMRRTKAYGGGGEAIKGRLFNQIS